MISAAASRDACTAVTALLRATPEALAFDLLRGDAQFARIAPARRLELIEFALAEGESKAHSVRAQLGNDPEAILGNCGVGVEHSDAEAGFGATLVFAEYQERPPGVTLYRPAMRRLEAVLARLRLQETLRLHDAGPVYLAHELFHHLDCQDAAGPIARRRPLVLLRLGTWRWTSGVSSLNEIAAGAFAQTLLGLSFHPRLLDLLALFAVNETAAPRRVQAALSLPQDAFDCSPSCDQQAANASVSAAPGVSLNTKPLLQRRSAP